jgi:deoxycytidylate deaminase
MHISALGFNKKNECVASATNKSRFCRKGGGVHAEDQIMIQAKRKGITSILVCRINKGGNFLPIDPCEKCQALAKKLGITIKTIKR